MLASNPQEEIQGTEIKITAQETVKDSIILFVTYFYSYLIISKNKVIIVMLYNAYDILTHDLPKIDIMKEEKGNKTIQKQIFVNTVKTTLILIQIK